MAAVELATLMGSESIGDAVRSIIRGLKTLVSEEEAEVRLHALELLKGGLRRHDVASSGVVAGRS